MVHSNIFLLSSLAVPSEGQPYQSSTIATALGGGRFAAVDGLYMKESDDEICELADPFSKSPCSNHKGPVLCVNKHELQLTRTHATCRTHVRT